MMMTMMMMSLILLIIHAIHPSLHMIFDLSGQVLVFPNEGLESHHSPITVISFGKGMRKRVIEIFVEI